MKPIRIVTAGLAAVALTTSLYAQQRDTSPPRVPPSMRHDGMGMGGGMGMGMGMEGMMGHMGEMMQPMMRVMVSSPAHLIMHREPLDLTDQQVQKLTALRNASQTAEQAARDDADKHAKELADVLAKPNPDTNQLKMHFNAMQAAMAKGHWAALSAAAQARAILTETQRARVDGWADAMEQMMPMGRGMRPGGPPNDSTKR
ncbi:MAG TPA: Spy/CpxP family protein refolding chaperone [Gemmatimonadales bacterium]|nr:Spy/CpxP family protein refolding chaperone [Gemmatimonadales bacterium]